jgi:hypothetical protein
MLVKNHNKYTQDDDPGRLQERIFTSTFRSRHAGSGAGFPLTLAAGSGACILGNTSKGDFEMSQPSVRRIITNRQLNFTLSPVDTYNHKDMPYALPNYEIDGTWNHHQSIILDLLLDRIFHQIYSGYKKPPQSWRSRKAIEATGHIFGKVITPESLTQLSNKPRKAYLKSIGTDVIGRLKENYEGIKIRNPEYTQPHTFEDYLNDHFDNDTDFQRFKEDQQELLQRMQKRYEVSLPLVDLLDNYPILGRYKYSLNDHLRKISETRFKLT